MTYAIAAILGFGGYEPPASRHADTAVSPIGGQAGSQPSKQSNELARARAFGAVTLLAHGDIISN